MSGSYKRKDHYHQKAQAAGYRSRAAYKLVELDRKFGILKSGFKIVDLGAWPGGWVQVSSSRVGPRGLVIGIDLREIEDISNANVHTICGDVREEEVLKSALQVTGGQFDVLLSDMAPKLTGIKSVDPVACVGCAELALWAAGDLLRPGGNLVIKLFKSNEAEEFVRAARPQFQKLVRCELKSTRKSSNEFYAVGLGFVPPPTDS